MTPPDDLTEAMRAALERVPDEWGIGPISNGLMFWELKELASDGLIEQRRTPELVLQFRRTPAGRSILAKGLGK